MTHKHIYLAGGCFWGTEHLFKQIAGVVETEVGFANGQTDNPTYEQVYTDTTGYAETVHVTYDPNKVSLDFLLRMFFVAIDPTSLNKQGHDEGTRYRTGIYYRDATDLPTIENCFRLYSAARLMMGAYHPYLDPLGITYPQYLVLLVLWEQDKQPVCDIGKRLMLDTNTMTPLLQRMEKAGLITRTRGKEDTRQRIVSLTKQGKALYEQAQFIPENMQKAVMMPDEEMNELLQMIPSLDKLIEELKKLNK